MVASRCRGTGRSHGGWTSELGDINVYGRPYPGTDGCHNDPHSWTQVRAQAKMSFWLTRYAGAVGSVRPATPAGIIVCRTHPSVNRCFHAGPVSQPYLPLQQALSFPTISLPSCCDGRII